MSIASAASVDETHLSTLFFTPERVYKLLKPVSLPFVDFSDTAARLAAATVEYERNRAISPDVYLGLADVYEQGELRDRMIVMRRLPADRELRSLLAKNPDPELIVQIARHVASMHAGLDSLYGDAAEPATLDAIAHNWEDNFAAMQPHLGTVIEPDEFHEVASLARTYLAGRAPLFQQRIDDGWVRDGHGDLRAEHIFCTADGPRLIDCVAFDDRLRISDSLADVAFLAMDLDRLAGPDAAAAFMGAWNEFTNEHHPSSLAHFYVAYRAHVRSKIACLRHAGGQAGAAQVGRSYHQLARRHMAHARIRLVLVGGGPGSGKSTIAEHVASDIGAAWLRSDEVRKDVAGVGRDEHHFEEPEQGLYSGEVSARTLEELMRQTEMLLHNGVSVVLDATWRSAEDRAALRALASRCAARTSELRCVLPAAIAKERIARRMASMYNPSDATPELVDYFATRFDEWPESTPVDTSRPIRESLAAASQALTPRTHVTRPPTARTVSHFISLVESGFYDGLDFHQVIDSLLALTGDPTSSGSGNSGQFLIDEAQGEDAPRRALRGSVLMAKLPADKGQFIPNSGSSQFAILFVPRLGVHRSQTIIGRVVEGMDVVSRLRRIDPSKEKKKGQVEVAPDQILQAEVINRPESLPKPNYLTMPSRVGS